MKVIQLDDRVLEKNEEMKEEEYVKEQLKKGMQWLDGVLCTCTHTHTHTRMHTHL